MEKKDKIKCVLIDFEQNEKTLDEAAKEILRLLGVVERSEQLKAISDLKDFAYDVCPLHREDDLEEILGRL